MDHSHSKDNPIPRRPREAISRDVAPTHFDAFGQLCDDISAIARAKKTSRDECDSEKMQQGLRCKFWQQTKAGINAN